MKDMYVERTDERQRRIDAVLDRIVIACLLVVSGVAAGYWRMFQEVCLKPCG